MIKAILFDMDGVLVDAKDWHYEALNRALEESGHPAISYEKHLECYDGLPTRKKLEMLSEQEGLAPEKHDHISARKQFYTQEIAQEKHKPDPVHVETIRTLAERGYKMAVCSNSIRETVIALITGAGLMEYMQFVLSNEDVSKPKPDGEIYITAIEKMGYKPEECLILEDNHNGIIAARASGAHLLEIKDVSDVNLPNIDAAIRLAMKEAREDEDLACYSC